MDDDVQDLSTDPGLVHGSESLIHGGRSVLVPSFVLIFPMLQSCNTVHSELCIDVDEKATPSIDPILHLRPRDQSAVPTNAVFIHRSGPYPWTPGIHERSATYNVVGPVYLSHVTGPYSALALIGCWSITVWFFVSTVTNSTCVTVFKLVDI